MDLSLIIVSYNTRELLNRCLSSLFSPEFRQDAVEVIVVDNASTDGSPAMVADRFPSVKLIRNQQNIGFGRANDLAAQVARGQYLLFLNSDTVLFENTLTILRSRLTQDQPELASFRLENPDGSLQPKGGFHPHLINLLLWMLNLDNLPLMRSLVRPYQVRYHRFFDCDRSIGWVGGTALLIKATIFAALNGFDPQIFMYAEDVDLCYRACRRGYRVRYWASPAIIHLGQGSSTAAASIIGEFNGLRYFFRQHKPRWQTPLLRLELKLGCLLRFLVFAIIGKHDDSETYRKALALV